MAFLDTDDYGDDFINVDGRTGATGGWDDVLAVQALLQLIFAHATDLKRTSPVKGGLTPTGKGSKETSQLIAHFQKVRLKRAKPQGFVDQAVGDRKSSFTIAALNGVATIVLLGIKSPHRDAVSYVRETFPLLAPKLRREPTHEIVEQLR